jgi:RND family efflux transporter MFP subunit
MKMILSAALALVLLSGCSGATNDATPAPEALVSLAAASTQTVGETIRLYGTADSGPGGRASLTAPIEARMVSIEAPVGSAVAPGQAIVRLAPGPTATSDIARARSDARVASAAYARALRMRGDGLVSDADVETAHAALASANATVSGLTGRSLILRAPIAGHVQAIANVAGDLVAAGATIVSISGNGAARAHFGVDPMTASTLKPGASIHISRGAGREMFAVRVSTVDPVVDAQTRLASVYADLPAAAQMRPGEPLSGELSLRGGAPSLVIPYAALLDDAGQPYVYVVAKGVANRRDITTGPTDGTLVSVTHGLAAGENVVVAGGTALNDGMKVRLK